MTLEKMKMAEGTNIEEMLVEYVDKCNVLSETNAKLEVDNKIINTMCSELKNEKNLVEIELEREKVKTKNYEAKISEKNKNVINKNLQDLIDAKNKKSEENCRKIREDYDKRFKNK